MEDLLRKQSELVYKTFVLWIGTLFILLVVTTIFIRDFSQEMERQARLQGGGNVDMMSAFYMADGLTLDQLERFMANPMI